MRSLIRLCAAAAAAAPLAAAASLPAATAGSSPIQHVVIIYLENHSFDNVLGYWCDDHPARCPDGGMPAKVTLSDGAVVTPAVDPDKIPNIAHNGPSQLVAMDNGKMDGWENMQPSGAMTGCGARYSYSCISGYQLSQEPNFAALANRFAISDMTFSL